MEVSSLVFEFAGVFAWKTAREQAEIELMVGKYRLYMLLLDKLHVSKLHAVGPILPTKEKCKRVDIAAKVANELHIEVL
eukprot:378624-Karenia_brevis.AAC.1